MQYCFMASLSDFEGRSTPHGELAESLNGFQLRLPYPMPEKPNCCAWYNRTLTKEEIAKKYIEFMSKHQ